MKELIEKLQGIGLTVNESRVYLFLLQKKEAKTGLICSSLNIYNSHIYEILEKLIQKGLVNYKLSNNIKIFRPASPESLFALFKEKEIKLEKEKENLKNFIDNLKKIESKKRKENDFKYFEGSAGVRSMISELVKNFEENSEIYIISAQLTYEKWNAFLIGYFHPPRIKKKINLKLIVPSSISQYGKEREKLKPIEIKYTNIGLESEVGIMGDYVYFLSHGNKPYALLIKDPNLASTQKQLFHTFWKTAKN